MRWLTVTLLLLVLALQYPLWLGSGSWRRVWQLDHQVASQKRINVSLHNRNDALEAEVRDLKTGDTAIEERARTELGMVKPGEVYYQVVSEGK